MKASSKPTSRYLRCTQMQKEPFSSARDSGTFFVQTGAASSAGIAAFVVVALSSGQSQGVFVPGEFLLQPVGVCIVRSQDTATEEQL